MIKHIIMCGFSLIELMITISIIGILTIIALPSYRHYTIRARFAEVISATEPYKTAVSIAMQQGYPHQEITNNQHGIPPEPASTKHLASLKIKNGVITATATALASGATYILQPDTNGFTWTIKGTCLEKGLCND